MHVCKQAREFTTDITRCIHYAKIAITIVGSRFSARTQDVWDLGPVNPVHKFVESGPKSQVLVHV